MHQRSARPSARHGGPAPPGIRSSDGRSSTRPHGPHPREVPGGRQTSPAGRRGIPVVCAGEKRGQSHRCDPYVTIIGISIWPALWSRTRYPEAGGGQDPARSRLSLLQRKVMRMKDTAINLLKILEESPARYRASGSQSSRNHPIGRLETGGTPTVGMHPSSRAEGIALSHDRQTPPV